MSDANKPGPNATKAEKVAALRAAINTLEEQIQVLSEPEVVKAGVMAGDTPAAGHKVCAGTHNMLKADDWSVTGNWICQDCGWTA